MTDPCKRRAQSPLPCPQLTAIPDELGDYIARDERLVRDLGWEDFVKKRRGQVDLSDMGGLDHPDRRLLRKYHHRGAPVVFLVQWWTE